jgi:hypothetical protein
MAPKVTSDKEEKKALAPFLQLLFVMQVFRIISLILLLILF